MRNLFAELAVCSADSSELDCLTSSNRFSTLDLTAVLKLFKIPSLGLELDCNLSKLLKPPKLVAYFQEELSAGLFRENSERNS